eukprot:scaffold45323_cov28-Tisochrysis_lutea.AAC.5
MIPKRHAHHTLRGRNIGRDRGKARVGKTSLRRRIRKGWRVFSQLKVLWKSRANGRSESRRRGLRLRCGELKRLRGPIPTSRPQPEARGSVWDLIHIQAVLLLDELGVTGRAGG